VLAEVAIAIAGFSGIAVVLFDPGESWAESDKIRFSLLLQLSFASVLFAFLPILLYLMHPSEPMAWRWASGLWLTYVFCSVTYRVVKVRANSNLDMDQFARVVACFMFGSLAVATLVQVVNVVRLSTAWPHVLAVMEGILMSFFLFARLLHRVVKRRSEG